MVHYEFRTSAILRPSNIFLSTRASFTIATSRCGGFANFSSIGIQSAASRACRRSAQATRQIRGSRACLLEHGHMSSRLHRSEILTLGRGKDFCRREGNAEVPFPANGRPLPFRKKPSFRPKIALCPRLPALGSFVLGSSPDFPTRSYPSSTTSITFPSPPALGSTPDNRVSAGLSHRSPGMRAASISTRRILRGLRFVPIRVFFPSLLKAVLLPTPSGVIKKEFTLPPPRLLSTIQSTCRRQPTPPDQRR